MTAGLRVLFVVGPATGGMGAHVAALTRGLAGLGWPVTTFTSGVTAERFAFGGTVCDAWPLRPGAPGTGRALPAAPRILRRLLAEAQVVHAHGHHGGLLALGAARTLRRADRPAIAISWHNAVLDAGLRRRLLGAGEAVQARGADLLTGASPDLVARGRALGARRVELAEVAIAPVVANRAEETAADPLLASLFDPQRSAAEAAGAGPVVLSVSRIAPQKRLDILVEAAAVLHRRLPGARWLVVGDGDRALLADLERQASARSAPVRFVGERRDVPALMAAADVLAVSSAWEARALVVQEAMALGLPVVATQVGGLPDLLNGTGLLVPPGDAVALAGAVERLLTDRILAAGLARAAKDRFAGFPTESDVLAAWVRRYQSLALPVTPMA